MEEKKKFTSCDKYDYLISAACGMTGALIDLCFVRAPGESPLCDWSDKQFERSVKTFARLTGWKPGKEKNAFAAAKEHLEEKFPVNYDQSIIKGKANFKMSPSDHHMKSPGHSPDIVGLFFSLMNQLFSSSSFVDDGKLYVIDAKWKKEANINGLNPVEKIFFALVNWSGHLMSDVAGSHESKGRGCGLTAPFYELFGLCDFGSFKTDKGVKDLSEIATQVYRKGYDARYAAAASIPAAVTELFIRFIWGVRQRFQYKKEIPDCIGTSDNEDLRIMLIVGYGSLCFADGADAAVRGIESGNFLTFFSRLNLTGWARLAVLICNDIRLRNNIKIFDKSDVYMQMIFGVLSAGEKNKVDAFIKSDLQILSYDYVLRELKKALEDEKLAKEQRIKTQAECEKNIALIKKERDRIFAVTQSCLNNYLDAFDEGEWLMDEGERDDDSDKYLKGGAAVQKALDYDVSFESQDEFDDLMSGDEDFVL